MFGLSILIFSNNLFAEINSIVPLKKPVLSKEEIQKKISINILKPLKKPSKTKEIKIEEVIVKKELADEFQDISEKEEEFPHGFTAGGHPVDRKSVV